MDIRRIIRCSSCGRKLGIYCGGDLKLVYWHIDF